MEEPVSDPKAIVSMLNRARRAVKRGDVEVGRAALRSVLLLEDQGRELTPPDLFAMGRLENAIDWSVGRMV